MKNEFSSLTLSNTKLVNDLKNSNFLEEQLKKVNYENYNLSNEMLELRNSISKFQKGKATLDNLLKSQKPHGDIEEIGYENRTSSSSLSHINFVKYSSYSTLSSFKQNESQTFKVKRSQVSNTKVKSNKTQSFMTQRRKDHTRKTQSKHAYMYTRHNNHKYVAQHNAHNHGAQVYHNTHCHYKCMSHSMTQKSYRKHPPP